MAKWTKWAIGITTVTIMLAFLATRWAMRQTQYVPEFYKKASHFYPVSPKIARKQLDAEVEQLQVDAAKQGTWYTAFSDQQINAWLLEEWPVKFPLLQRYGAREPRVQIQDNRLLAAVRFTRGGIDTIVSCEIKTELTEQPNMLAVKVSNLRAGALPLPMSSFLKTISKEAARGGLDIRWDMTPDGPIALVTVPSDDPRYTISPVVVETVHLVRGALYLAGHSGELTAESFQPQGPLHEFVSFSPPMHRNESVPAEQLSRASTESSATKSSIVR